MIDKSGQWWKGDAFAALVEYVGEYTAATGYQAQQVRQSTCTRCGGTTMVLLVDDEAGCAQRRCEVCDLTAFIADADEYEDEADLGEAACPCSGERFEVGVGFSAREDGDISWVTVGCRCVACGILGVYADWKVDYLPTDHLFAAV